MIKKLILGFLVVYMFIALGFYLFQERIIFRSKKLAKNFTFSLTTKFQELHIATGDHTSINALHIKVDHPKGVVLYFHGNKGNLQRWGEIVSPYTDYQYDVVVVDYRGYGKSTGKRSESAMYQDAQEIYEYVQSTLGFEEGEIVLYGRSLGCTFATYVASRNQPKQLVLEAPFNSLIEIIKGKFPLLPYNQLLNYPFRTFTFIPKVAVPIVIFHGAEDLLVPIESGEKLFEAANKEYAEFVRIETGTHHNLTSFEVYKDKLIQILE